MAPLSLRVRSVRHHEDLGHVLKERIAAPDQLGRHVDAEPVNLVSIKKGPDDVLAGQNDDVSRALLAQLLHGGGWVAVDNAGVAP